MMKVFAQTPRWCQLTTTLWSLIVLDTSRSVDANGLSQFIEVINWRAHGKITAEEFSVLYSEWMLLSDPAAPVTSGPASSSAANASAKKKAAVVPLAALRSLLVEKGCGESDLDLFIGMVVHESNLRMANNTIGYGGNKKTLKASSFRLEVVNQRWLALSEELFFSLDTPGYGAWKFDEVMFFCACISIGLQGWRNEQELEADLALSTLSAMALQMLRDAGASPLISSSRNTLGNQTIAPRSSIAGEQGGARAKRGTHARQEITLVMLKRYLVRRNISENDLALLVQHVKFCVEQLVRLAKVMGAEEFYLACQPIEHRGSIIGSPRLWQEAVLIAAGFSSQIAAVHTQGLPPVILFLLTDAERHVSGALRAIEFLVDVDEGFVDALTNEHPVFSPKHALAANMNPQFSHVAANEELHENAQRLWSQFSRWSQEGGSLSASIATNNPLRPQSVNSSELSHDPVYRLIFTALTQYKSMQQVLNAALFDFSLSQFGASPAADLAPSELAVLCAGLTVNTRDVLVELGLEDNAAPVDAAPSPALESFIAEEAQTVASAQDNMSVVSSSVFSRKSYGESVSKASHRSKSVPETDLSESEDDVSSSPTSLSTGTTTKKISELAITGRRKSLLSQQESTSPSLSVQKNEPVKDASVKPKEKKTKDKDAVPNYFKPTATFLARNGNKTADAANSSTSNAQMPPAVPTTADPFAGVQRTQRSAARKTQNSAPSAQPQTEERSDPQWEKVLDARPQGIVPPPPPPPTPTVVENLPPAPSAPRVMTSTKPALDRPPAKAPSSHNKQMEAPSPQQRPIASRNNESKAGNISPPVHRWASEQYFAEESLPSDISSVAPSSIEELLQQGHSPGKYAQTLREILRKMSKDDSHVRLKSLEQVIQLGQSIVEASEEKRKKSPIFGSSMNGVHVSPSRSHQDFSRDREDYPNRKSKLEMRSNSRQPVAEEKRAPRVPATPPAAVNSNVKIISRSTGVPGLRPDHLAKKSTKAFGHPING